MNTEKYLTHLTNPQEIKAKKVGFKLRRTDVMVCLENIYSALTFFTTEDLLSTRIGCLKNHFHLLNTNFTPTQLIDNLNIMTILYNTVNILLDYKAQLEKVGIKESEIFDISNLSEKEAELLPVYEKKLKVEAQFYAQLLSISLEDLLKDFSYIKFLFDEGLYKIDYAIERCEKKRKGNIVASKKILLNLKKKENAILKDCYTCIHYKCIATSKVYEMIGKELKLIRPSVLEKLNKEIESGENTRSN